MQITRTPRRLDALIGPGSNGTPLSALGSRHAAHRRAFTLIELLVVIAVIAVLAGFLLAGVFNVFGTARVAQVSADINSFNKGIAEFGLRYGIHPPSYFVLYENGPMWGTTPLDQRSRAIVRRVWPSYDFGSHDINGDGDSTDVIRLQGMESLMFFLGGNSVLIQEDLMLGAGLQQPPAPGFSTNPTNPFIDRFNQSSRSSKRVGPFFDFDRARFTDVDADGNPEYMDPIPGQTMPYIYLSGYEGAGYRPFGPDGMVGTIDDEMIAIGSTPLMASAYLINDKNWPNTGGRPDAISTEFINPKSYQLISPGQDMQYGAGGGYIRGEGLATFSGMDPYRTRDVRKAEFDNITNFTGGLIGEQTVDKPAI
ncbi:MAG: type II secretion system protein [Planctomycetaceae bacterium]|nr:type II secretion system protein [Planctomycetaceae bacterium]